MSFEAGSTRKSEMPGEPKKEEVHRARYLPPSFTPEPSWNGTYFLQGLPGSGVTEGLAMVPPRLWRKKIPSFFFASLEGWFLLLSVAKAEESYA